MSNWRSPRVEATGDTRAHLSIGSCSGYKSSCTSSAASKWRVANRSGSGLRQMLALHPAGSTEKPTPFNANSRRQAEIIALPVTVNRFGFDTGYWPVVTAKLAMHPMQARGGRKLPRLSLSLCGPALPYISRNANRPAICSHCLPGSGHVS